MKDVKVLISLNISKEEIYHVEESEDEINYDDLHDEIYRNLLSFPIELTMNSKDDTKWMIDSLEIL